MGAVVVIGFFALIAFIVREIFAYRKVKLDSDMQKEIENLTKENDMLKTSLKLALFIVLGLGLQACGFEQVDEGYRGVKTVWGRVEGEALTPGLYFYNPVSSSIFEMSVKEEKWEFKTAAFTKDTQTVTVEIMITYYPEQTAIQAIYSQFGRDWSEKILAPVVLGSLKDSIGQYVADDLVNKREAVKKAAELEIRNALTAKKVNVTGLNITNLDFDDAYEKAVEDKVIASQRAIEAKNKSVQVSEESKQVVMRAQAEAESMKIRAQALSQNKALVEYEAVQKWNGVLPQYQFGSSTPFINLSK